MEGLSNSSDVALSVGAGVAAAFCITWSLELRDLARQWRTAEARVS